MNRDEMIEAGQSVYIEHWRVRPDSPDGECHCGNVLDWGQRYSRHVVEAMVDAILPQVQSVSDLGALPFGTKVLDVEGEVWSRYRLAASGVRPLRWRDTRGRYGWTSQRLAQYNPLTVVWTP